MDALPRVSKTALQKIRQLVPSANVSGIAADLGTKDGVTTFTKHVPHADVLVNNLGIFEVKPFLEIPDEDWHRFFRHKRLERSPPHTPLPAGYAQE